MRNDNSYEWLSVCIFINNEEFVELHRMINDFIVSESRKAIIRKYFFVKMFYKSPHLRLRLFIEDKHYLTIREDLIRYFSAYEMRIIPYRREIMRYGGPKAISIAETQFYYSSKIINSFLCGKESPNYVQRVAFALSLNIGMCKALSANIQIQKRFLRFQSDHFLWKKSSLKKELVLRYQKEKELVINVIRTMLRSDRQDDFDPIARNWIHLMRRILYSFEELQVNNELINPKCDYLSSQKLPHEPFGLWHIIESLSHMSHNRLGITGKDEGYLYYLLSEID